MISKALGMLLVLGSVVAVAEDYYYGPRDRWDYPESRGYHGESYDYVRPRWDGYSRHYQYTSPSGRYEEWGDTERRGGFWSPSYQSSHGRSRVTPNGYHYEYRSESYQTKSNRSWWWPF